MTESEDIGFVVCASCGARIKADRGWCLRCHEPLRAWKKPEIPLPSWVHALGGGTLIFGVVAIAAVGLVAYVSIDSTSASKAIPDRPPSPQVRTAADDAAPPHLQPVARIDPVMFIAGSRRGTAEIADNALVDARVRFEQALQRDPRDADSLNNLGLVLERLGYVDTAVTRFTVAVSVDPRNWMYHFNLARALSLQKNWNRAATEYEAVIELFPDNFPAQYNMAVALHQSGDENAAITAFEKAIVLAPGEPAARLSLAVSLEASGRTEEASSQYRRYLEMLPGAADAGAVKARLQTLSHES